MCHGEAEPSRIGSKEIVVGGPCTSYLTGCVLVGVVGMWKCATWKFIPVAPGRYEAD